MISDPRKPLQLVARVLQESGTDGLSPPQAALIGHLLRGLAQNVEDDRLDNLPAILHSMAFVMSEGTVSPSLAFLLEIAAQNALDLMDSLSAKERLPLSMD
ncbi:hypothetical protein [Dyella sp. C11]|uniref:hypothetical protein n=1 Tax=Dyella sp. C11 TaxID=2126991 RepID=UPI00130048F9|nr:hypothetical protein [Dyella sp. C11]